MGDIVDSTTRPDPIKRPDETPQQALNRFWKSFTSKKRGKPLTVLPQNDLAERLFETQPKDGVLTEPATANYDHAVAKCKAKVASIVKECRRINQKYCDAHFDLENRPMCLKPLTAESVPFCPGSILRVTEIFSDPQFFLDGVSSNDVRQGRNGDCWFLAAVAALSNVEGLMLKNCVARDEEVGVYGFVFHRDGEWISEIIDDKLYLTKPHYHDSSNDRRLFEETGRQGWNEQKYRQVYLTGSDALYFAQCREENETWLPLLEKAFAKVHGDYEAIDGGYTGEAIEDLTGGITTEVRSTDILDKKKFWEELLQCNRQFVFGCSTGMYHGGADNSQGGHYTRRGIVEGHAYSVLRAVEMDGQKLVLLHNPWGEREWSGPWSDGSEQWTSAWLERLQHKFGDDGVFWMSYADLLTNFELFDRTRLFGPEWTSTQVWTSLAVPWKLGYHDTRFCFRLERDGLVVIALSQLDSRYFQGLEGQYTFSLHFRLEKDDDDEFVVRSNANYTMERSVNTELFLDAGAYTVYVKVVATRCPDKRAVEDVVSQVSKDDREKLMQVGMRYDLAHTKREIRETEDERKIKARKEKEKARQEKAAARRRERRLKAKKKRQAEREKKAKARLEKKAAAPAPAVAGADGGAKENRIPAEGAAPGVPVDTNESKKEDKVGEDVAAVVVSKGEAAGAAAAAVDTGGPKEADKINGHAPEAATEAEHATKKDGEATTKASEEAEVALRKQPDGGDAHAEGGPWTVTDGDGGGQGAKEEEKKEKKEGEKKEVREKEVEKTGGEKKEGEKKEGEKTEGEKTEGEKTEGEKPVEVKAEGGAKKEGDQTEEVKAVGGAKKEGDQTEEAKADEGKSKEEGKKPEEQQQQPPNKPEPSSESDSDSSSDTDSDTDSDSDAQSNDSFSSSSSLWDPKPSDGTGTGSNDEWNAIAVVGLRVFSLTSAKVTDLKVVSPAATAAATKAAKLAASSSSSSSSLSSETKKTDKSEEKKKTNANVVIDVDESAAADAKADVRAAEKREEEEQEEKEEAENEKTRGSGMS